MDFFEKDKIITVIGLGYVGLPLALLFSSKYQCIGFDINKNRISDLKKGIDITKEHSKKQISSKKKLRFTSKLEDLKIANIFVITVPTPITSTNSPDLKIIKNATRMVSKVIKKDDIVIFESTVYPGLSEHLAVNILEKYSGLIYNKDFFIGYSPERINPGDNINNIQSICKVTSGSNLKTAKIIDNLYKSVINAGTYLAPSIKVAEAAKVIENTQRDLNIALFNELSIIFNKIGIETVDVINAAKTKWNFIPFEPGLVGGHCIGVDPYYLTYKSKEVGHNPKIILSGRKINNNMTKHIYNLLDLEIKKEKNLKKIPKNNRNILILGFSFKENIPDIRNTKIIDLYNHFKKKQIQNRYL